MGFITTQSSTTGQTSGADARAVQLTNWGETAGFFLARAIAAGVSYLLVPFYTWLFRTGGAVLMSAGAVSIGVLIWLATLLLFLLLRALFGGVPPIVAPQHRKRAFTSSSGEIVAYITTSLVVLVIVTALGRTIANIYVSLRNAGHADLVLPVAVIVWATTAGTFFVIFLVLRRAMLKAAEIARFVDQSRGGKNVGFGQAVAICFGKYTEFNGRAGRPEYWFWVLFQVLFGMVLTIVDLLIFNVPDHGFSALVSLVLFLPSLAVTVRRLHDIDYSGWWLLILAVPLIGAIILLVMTCLPGTKESNRFGPGLT